MKTGNLLDQALTASLPVFTGTSKELVSKSVADTRTALGLTYDSILPWVIDIDVFMAPSANTNFNNKQIGDATQTFYYGGWKYNSGAQNDSITWNIPLAAGTWSVELCYNKVSDAGIISIQFDDVEKGTIDCYIAGWSGNHFTSVSGISLATTGKTSFKLKMTTKNSSSSGYYAYLQHIRLLRTT